jgi:hypothetical protein
MNYDIIGDIHGTLDALMSLLIKLSYTRKTWDGSMSLRFYCFNLFFVQACNLTDYIEIKAFVYH